LRAANCGSSLGLNLKIDGKSAANLLPGGRYDHFVSEGRHMLIVVVSNHQPTSTVLDVRSGQRYVFTATRQNRGSVVLVPSALPSVQQPKWACDWSTRFLRCHNSR